MAELENTIKKIEECFRNEHNGFCRIRSSLLWHIRELLKERKPRKVKNIRKVTNICLCGDCPSCGGRIYNTLNPNFCGHCGDCIDWKDGDGK